MPISIMIIVTIMFIALVYWLASSMAWKAMNENDTPKFFGGAKYEVLTGTSEFYKHLIGLTLTYSEDENYFYDENHVSSEFSVEHVLDGYVNVTLMDIVDGEWYEITDTRLSVLHSDLTGKRLRYCAKKDSFTNDHLYLNRSTEFDKMFTLKHLPMGV